MYTRHDYKEIAKDKKILSEIYEKLYTKDVDYSVNIFLCGAITKDNRSIRKLLNDQLKNDAKFNTVYPEHIFSKLTGKGKYNILELENELASYVDVIILPLEGAGTLCELGAFTSNEALLPKIIAINNSKYEKQKSFINLGPLELIKKKHPYNFVSYDEENIEDSISKVLNKVRNRKPQNVYSYDIKNLFNLSRYILYLIAIYQPITEKKIIHLIELLDKGKATRKYVDSAIKILTQKQRISLNPKIESSKYNNKSYCLSASGHLYVYEELIEKLNIKKHFTSIRCEIINDKYKNNIRRSKELLVSRYPL